MYDVPPTLVLVPAAVTAAAAARGREGAEVRVGLAEALVRCKWSWTRERRCIMHSACVHVCMCV